MPLAFTRRFGRVRFFTVEGSMMPSATSRSYGRGCPLGSFTG